MRLRQAMKIWHQPYLISLTSPYKLVRKQLDRATTRLLRSKRHRYLVDEQREMEYALRAIFGPLRSAPMSETKKDEVQ